MFRFGEIELSAGGTSDWKIECDDLTPEEIKGIAKIIFDNAGPFRFAIGVPRGGLPFAHELNVLNAFRRISDSYPILLVDDVWNTGGSLLRMRAKMPLNQPCLKWAAFARGELHSGAHAVFEVTKLT